MPLEATAPKLQTAPASGRAEARRAPTRAALTVVALTGLLAVAGGALALAGLDAGARHSATIAYSAPGGEAWTAATSFGTLSVLRVERAAGGPGLEHGHSGAGADRVSVVVTMTNRGRNAVPYSPGQLRLRLGESAATIPSIDPIPPPGSIAAGQELQQRLTYVVPEARESFGLLFDDVRRSGPVSIELGALAAGSGV